MKSRNLRDMQADYQDGIPSLTCMICQKKIQGFYGRHGLEGTCSLKCEGVQAAKYPYPDHREEDFFNRFLKRRKDNGTTT